MLALAVTTPAYAQQTVDEQTRNQAEAIVAQYVDALNKGDGPGRAALYAAGPRVDITPFGKNTAIAQIEDEVKTVHSRGLSLSAKADDVVPLSGGQVVVVTAPYNGMYSNNPATPKVQGNLMFVLERDGGGWKIRATSATRLAQPAPK